GHTPVALAAAARSGRVVVSNYDDGSVSLLDARTGAHLATVHLGHKPIALALDETRGRVFTLNGCDALPPPIPEQACPGGAGSVSALDRSSSGALGAAPLSDLATQIRVDEPAGRVFVAHMYSGAVMLDAAGGRVLRTLDGGLNVLSLTVDSRTRHV